MNKKNVDVMSKKSKQSGVEAKSFSNYQLKIDDLPQWEDIEYEPLAKAAHWEPFFQLSLGFSVFLLIVSGTFFVPFIPLFISVCALLTVIFLFAILQWHNFEEHKVRGVALREKDIIFKKGLFWRRSTLLPFNKVQHIEFHRNPIERKLGLSRLNIFTAGGSGVDLQIRGLENERAEKIKQYILEKSKKNFVDK